MLVVETYLAADVAVNVAAAAAAVCIVRWNVAIWLDAGAAHTHENVQ